MGIATTTLVLNSMGPTNHIQSGAKIFAPLG
jgi:hypothetical protein